MEFNYYQELAAKNKVYGYGMSVIYPCLGLGGEAGEVLDKVKKVLRDKDGDFSSSKEAIVDELGDVLWYLSAIAGDLNVALEWVAQRNLEKLADRRARNTIHGSGDNR